MKRASKRYRTATMQCRLSTGGCFIAALLAMTWFIAAPVWADSSAQVRKLTNQEEGQTVQYSSLAVSIQKKSLKHIYAYGRTFAVNPETVILGPDGKEVSLKKMLVPCDAEVMYLIEKGVSIAKRIDIKRIASDASWQWTSEHPE